MEPVNAILLVILLICCAAIVWVVKEVIREKMAQRPVPSYVQEAEIDREIQKLHTAPCYDELRNFARHFVDWQSKRVCEYIRECLEPVQQSVDDWDASGAPYTSSYHYDRGKVRGYKDILKDLESGMLDKYMNERR